MLAVIYRIYGLEDHRQAESFNPSRVLDFRTNANGYERNIIIKSGYFDEDVKADFEALKNGTKALADLSKRFWNGEQDKKLLGI